ncbi:hypothetical protein GE253_17225 [Niveispirillum sp. SYP-B3756]|uniref:hypothetical protein n=1 Tax=Niveispirillum sp. SYP-B3756 TaxID=2662178 RepID=UPI0012915FDC|nr:hypothetical protein [Niveispirillum sp. SYP-B3756]MQP67071.1 hypothetical protein [Niveispirillum sp. SYP-B3756]
MGMFDFLKVNVTEKVSVPNYTAHLHIDGKQLSVANLGISSVTVTGTKLKVGQSVTFDLALKDPKQNLALKGTGTVATVDGKTAKINFTSLPDASKQAVARFLARYMINR